MTDDYTRPPVEDRTIRDRTEPVRIEIRTRWLYSKPYPDAVPADGEKRHGFSRSGRVVRSDVPSRYDHQNGVADHVYRAIELFGDDADLIIEVRRR